jgi:hypothetical protein
MNKRSPMILTEAKCKATLYGCATVLLAVLLALLPGPLKAQTTASLSGIVSDSTGAVVPGAKVTAINPATGDRVGTVTSDARTSLWSGAWLHK